MRRVLIGATLVAIAGVLATACGGGSSSQYEASATRACLASKGLTVKSENNPLADASGGNLAVDEGKYDVFLAFGKDDSEAGQIAAGLKADVARGGDPGARDTIKTKGNVVYYVNTEPFPNDAKADVENCLS